MIQEPLGFVTGLISDHLSAIYFCIVREIKGGRKKALSSAFLMLCSKHDIHELPSGI